MNLDRGYIAGVFAAVACASAPEPAATDADLEIPKRFSVATGSTAIQADWWHAFDDARLDALVEEALEENRDLELAVARLEAAAVQARLAGAGALPRVDAKLGVTQQRQLFLGFPDDLVGGPGGGAGAPSQDDGPLTSDVTLFEASLQASWEVDVWGRVRSAKSAAIGALQASEADLEAARLSVVGQVVKAYLGVARAEAELAVARDTLAKRRTRTEHLARRYEEGIASATDLRLARSDASANAAQVVELQRRLTAARRGLEILLGRYPRGDIEVAESVALAPVPAGLPSRLLLRRADLVAAERRLASAGARVDAAEAALFPRISLTANVGMRSAALADLVDEDFVFWNLAANLLQPIFRGGELRARVDLSEAEQKQALAEYSRTILSAFREVEDALTADAAIAERYADLERAAEEAVAARESATRSYELGVADFLRVLAADVRAYQAQRRLVRARLMRVQARVDLYLALGGGFAERSPQEAS